MTLCYHTSVDLVKEGKLQWEKSCFFCAICVTVGLMGASVATVGDDDMISKNLDWGRHIPDLWSTVYKEIA